MCMEVDYRECNRCGAKIEESVIDECYSICPICDNYLRYYAQKRINSITDNNSFREWEKSEERIDLQDDNEYLTKLNIAKRKCNLKEAVITGSAKIGGVKVAIGVMDTRFMMASMGHQVGEMITDLFERAKIKHLPVVLFCCSGGARMQEGIISLMQMEKTAAAVKRYKNSNLLYISILTEPTMGGVLASFATLADIILAEKGAMIGFAGPRVIEQNTGEKIAKDVQTSESFLQNGFIDEIVTRQGMREYIINLLELFCKKKVKINKGLHFKYKTKKCVRNIKYNNWDIVQIARSYKRPTSKEYIYRIFDNFVELHGDRLYGDDPTIMAGIAKFHDIPITVIGQQKGKKSMEEILYYNRGMTSPSGYRKALRIMKQAEKFQRPIVCFVDTVGAACDAKAEGQGQAYVIADILSEISAVDIPVLSIIIGEGNSGGALALGVANEVWMLENSVYSILSPEGYASILWKDGSKGKEAAENMKMCSYDLLSMGIIDKVIPENEPVTIDNMSSICQQLDNDILGFLRRYINKSKKDIVRSRNERFRKY